MIQADLERMEREIGSGTSETFTWKSQNVECIATSVRRGLIMEEGGNAYTIDLTLIVRREQFLDADASLSVLDSQLITTDSNLPEPVAGRTLSFRGRTYRIITARESGPRSHFELTLADSGSNR